MTPEQLIALLADALKSCKRGDCWCEMGIGNPMVTSHTQACKKARAALAEAEKRKAR